MLGEFGGTQMKISTRCRYATLALYDIAFHGGGELTQIRLIAKRQDIPPRFLEQIFQDLKRADLVDGKRGRNGGYFLKREPEDISLLDIIVATDGPMEESIGDKTERSVPQGGGPKTSRCIPAMVWGELSVKVQEVYGAYTLADLVEKAEAAGLSRGDAGYMYFI